MINEKLNILKQKIVAQQDRFATEESTKTALVLPFIQLLGYDIFNPDQVLPEYNCDLVKNKGEKVDYALLIKNKIEIIIECKGFNVDLTPHRNQLSRYFVSSKAKYGVLTNGVDYQFFTDLDNENLMDNAPFFQFSLKNYSSTDVETLQQFCFNNFDAKIINKNASESKIITEVTNEIKNLFDKPSPDIIKLFTRATYKGRYTESAISKLTTLFKRALNKYVNDRVSNQLNSILDSEENNNKIVTTEKEKQAFYIVQSILQDLIPTQDVVLKDQVSKCLILYKNDNSKPLLKLYFNDESNLEIELFDSESSRKISISAVEEIYNYKMNIISTGNNYLETTTTKRATPFKFNMIGLNAGDYVVFAPSNLKCKIVDDNTISYNEKEYSLSGFCREFMPQGMQNTSKTYQGPKYFTYNGVALVELREQKSNK